MVPKRSWPYGRRTPIPHHKTVRVPPPLRIAIASDHAAFALKAELAAALAEWGHDVIDLGPDSDARVDYPDFGYKLAEAVANGTAKRGVALCGSGIGISIAVNRNPACRAALVSDPYSATLSREPLHLFQATAHAVVVTAQTPGATFYTVGSCMPLMLLRTLPEQIRGRINVGD